MSKPKIVCLHDKGAIELSQSLIRQEDGSYEVIEEIKEEENAIT